LIVCPNTNDTLWWCEGTKIRIAMIAATPTTCQPTETLLNSATSGDEKMLTRACRTRISTNRTNVSLRMCAESPKLMNPRSSP
jgi:hypothetical protein